MLAIPKDNISNEKINSQDQVKVGDVFHRLTVLELIKDAKNPKALCKCVCGNLIKPQRGALKNGRAKSCGCLRKELLKKASDAKRGTGMSLEQKRILKAAISARWRKNNPEKRKIICRNYYEKNKDLIFLRRMKNRDKKRAYDAIYFQTNKDRLLINRRLHDHKRRLREIGQKGNVSRNILAKLMLLQKSKCAICTANLKIVGCHIDHIEPLANGGMHDDSNFQLLCPFCNKSKGAKDPIKYMQSKGFLL